MRSTLYKSIGGNWYSRTTPRGKIVKVQMSGVEYGRRNKLIRAKRNYDTMVRELGIEDTRDVLKQRDYIASLPKANEKVFDTKDYGGTYIIYEKDSKGLWKEKTRFDVTQENYWTDFKNKVFDPYYEQLSRGNLRYKFIKRGRRRKIERKRKRR